MKDDEMTKYFFPVWICLALLTFPCWAAPHYPTEQEAHLTTCLQHADEGPDQARAEAEAWLKKGGGDRALLCKAYALLHSGDDAQAAQTFLYLAHKRPASDHTGRAKLFEQAGLAYMQGHEAANAESSFSVAIKEAPDDLDLRFDRASARAAGDKLWEAIDDLKLVLQKEPERIEALRLSGQTWIKLGYETKGKADLLYAEQLATGGDPREKKEAPSKKAR